jgi:hypothetical protein
MYEFKKCYQPRTNIVKGKDSFLPAYSHYILTSEQLFYKLYNVN